MRGKLLASALSLIGVFVLARSGGAQVLRSPTTLWASDPAEVPELAQRVDAMIQAGDLVAVRSQADTQIPGRVHERFNQYYRGLRVFGGQVVWQTERGRPLTITGNLYPDVEVDVRAVLTGEEAVSRALAAGKAGARRVGPIELLILPLAERYVLAYYFHLRGPQSLEAVFVDARDGRVALRFFDLRREAAIGRGVGTWEDEKKISVDRNLGTHRASDLLRPAGIKTYDVGFDFDAWNTYSIDDSYLARDLDNNWTDGAVVDAHAYSGYVYDYYFKRHGRRGLDDSNLLAINFVHFLPRIEGFNNAFFDPVDNSMNYGDGDGITFNYFSSALDVVAHELTHGVTNFTSNLIYLNESGALNEAFSDVMGTSVEFFFEPAGNGRKRAEWLNGEDLFYSFGRFVRSLENPTAAGDPDHYSKRCLPPICTPDEEGDNGGVHINSAIASHGFYLLVEGGTNRTSGISVPGLGRSRMERAEKIFYRAFTFYLTPSSNFGAARAATLQAARDLYGAGSVEEQQVSEAWRAVGVM